MRQLSAETAADFMV